MFEAITPADIVNRTLDALGRSDIVLGDIEDGSEAAAPALRAYGPARRQLLRSAHWAFARRQLALTLLADATGQTPNVGTIVPAPWTYEYALPNDCVQARFLPWNSNPIMPNPPLMTGLGQPPLNAVRLQPAPFLLTMDSNYPVTSGTYAEWGDVPQWWWLSQTGPTTRTVVCTNVPPQPQTDAPTVMPSLVYTADVVFPNEWDDGFQEAMVCYLGQKLALSLVEDKKLALAIRTAMTETVKQQLSTARAQSANESGYPQTTDHTPDWVRARNQGGGPGGIWSPNGIYDTGSTWGGWSSCSFADGSVF